MIYEFITLLSATVLSTAKGSVCLSGAYISSTLCDGGMLNLGITDPASAAIPCGASAEDDLKLKLTIDSLQCCGAGGRSACDQDYSGICTTGGTFQLNANANGAIFNSQQLNCQSTMIALKDENVVNSLFGVSLSLDAKALATDLSSCGTNLLAGQLLDGIVLGTGCCTNDATSNAVGSTCFQPSSASLCSSGTYNGNHVRNPLPTGTTNAYTCDQVLTAKTGFSSSFSRLDSYPTCGELASNDEALQATLDLYQCCGGGGRSACGQDYSGICATGGTFQPTADATGAVVNGVQLKCQSTMIALKDENVVNSLFGVSLSLDAKALATDLSSCGTNLLAGQLLDGIVLGTGCCTNDTTTNAVGTTCFRPSSASLCSSGTYDGNHVQNPLLTGATNAYTCDQVLTAKTGFSSSFSRFNPYPTCGTLASNDLALKATLDLYQCCGTDGRSACDQDYSGICATGGTFQPNANATGVIVDSLQLTCQQTMIALHDKNVSLNGESFGQDPSTFQCNSDGKAANVLEGVVALTQCCGSNGHSKCWLDGSSNICQKDDAYVGSHVETPIKGTASTTTCDNILIGAPALFKDQKFDKENPTTFVCETNRLQAMGLDEMINRHNCCGPTGKSKCSKDWSYLCLEPSKWSPGAVPTDIPLVGKNKLKSTCHELAWYLYSNYKSLGFADIANPKLKAMCHDGKHDFDANLINLFLADGGCCGVGGQSVCAKQKEEAGPIATDYAVAHTIVLQGITAVQFNSDPLITKSFRQAIAVLLDVATTDIINLVANAKSRRGLTETMVQHRTLDTTASCSVAYDVKVTSKAAMTSMSVKMTSTFSDSKTFTNEFQNTLTTNNVGSVSPATITADTSSTPTNAGSLGKEEKREAEEPKDFPIGLVLGLCVGVGACLVVGGYLCYRRQQKENRLAKRVTELVEQRQHDAMNNNPMHSHEHKKKQRRSSKGFPGQVL